MGQLVGKCTCSTLVTSQHLLKPSSSYKSNTFLQIPYLPPRDFYYLKPSHPSSSAFTVADEELRNIIVPFYYSILHVYFRSIVQKAYLLPLYSSLSVISAFRKLNLSDIRPCPASYPSSVSVGLPPLSKSTTNPCLFTVANMLPEKLTD